MTIWRATTIPGPLRAVTRELQQLCEVIPSFVFFQTGAPDFGDEILLFVPSMAELNAF
jgi:hypothetical protein